MAQQWTIEVYVARSTNDAEMFGAICSRITAARPAAKLAGANIPAINITQCQVPLTAALRQKIGNVPCCFYTYRGKTQALRTSQEIVACLGDTYKNMIASSQASVPSRVPRPNMRPSAPSISKVEEEDDPEAPSDDKDTAAAKIAAFNRRREQMAGQHSQKRNTTVKFDDRMIDKVMETDPRYSGSVGNYQLHDNPEDELQDYYAGMGVARLDVSSALARRRAK